MKPIDQAILDTVIARKRQLMTMSATDLRQLARYAGEEFSACGKTQVLGVYHDKNPKGEDIFVVQCKRKLFMGFGFIFAEGFVLDSSDGIREAEEKLMWEYK